MYEQSRLNDNAGNGARGLRAIPSEELLHIVRNSYGFPHLKIIKDLGGSSCLNLLAIQNSDRFVIRVYRPYVTTARLADINLVRHTLYLQGIPVSEVELTRSGQSWVVFDHRLVEVERYVESDEHMNSWNYLMKGLPLLGRIHSILQNIECSPDGKTPRFANYIDPENVMNMTWRGTNRIRRWNQSSENTKLADAAELLAQSIITTDIPLLPKQIVHGDYWDNNVFFKDGRIVLVNDFDYMGERARIDDLALILYFYDCSAEPITDKRLDKLRRLVDAYDEGLNNHLSKTERAALPIAMARQPLWSIGGWIALLDDEEAAQRHAANMLDEVHWALNIVKDLNRWENAFK